MIPASIDILLSRLVQGSFARIADEKDVTGDVARLVSGSSEPVEAALLLHLLRQGNDVGTQYRSGIYYRSDEQRDTALRSLETYGSVLSGGGYGSVTTEILPAPDFFYAEDYHQQYLEKTLTRAGVKLFDGEEIANQPRQQTLATDC